ncbi:survival motor neuron protein [Nymphalis io]|uniref:survival motor neuron protein n=1 Tax=Inachis io TaxID=171585 RepID=UPI002169D369|nr:survival motor neuron protein [Nymphalis io]
MDKSNILYVKGMNLSDSEEDEVEAEDIWDDSKLNDAYDKALRIASAEVAKRVAMSTNSPASRNDLKTKTKLTSHSNYTKNQKNESKGQWKAGMHCRAVYEGDGVEYEALLLRIINNDECIVRFLGYENSEIVSISTLKASKGKTERTRQIEESLADKIEDDSTNCSFNVEKMECSDRPLSPGSSVSFQKKKKLGKKKHGQKQMNCFDLPDIPMPNFAQLRNIGTMDMPIPPPPPMNLPRCEVDSEDQAVSSMLLSWYMSGYYTGLYQGMKRAKDGRRNH